jgi:hypothetical protein
VPNGGDRSLLFTETWVRVHPVVFLIVATTTATTNHQIADGRRVARKTRIAVHSDSETGTEGRNVNIKAEVDVDGVVKLCATVLRQLPYAANNAITRTAKEAVDAGQKEIAADLMIRKRFILNRVKILQYSKVGNLTAIIGIDTKVQGSPLLLGFLEEGGTKEPTRGPNIAIPLTGEAARPTFSQSVVTSLRYTNLRFENRKGRKRTFIIPNVGIFQRVAAGDSPDATVLIYSFKPSAKLPQLIHLRAAMVKIIGERFNAIFSEEFTKEILKKAQRGG